METEISHLIKSSGDDSCHSGQSVHSSSPLLKKASPLKHVTPIIKKYDCQRQAKNGKSLKLKPQGKIMEEGLGVQPSKPVQNLAAGMDSLDAALRNAEKYLGKQEGPSDYSLDPGLEHNGDDLGVRIFGCTMFFNQDAEEEGTSSSTVASQQNATINRPVHLRNRNRVLKKRNQLQKDLEHALPLATSDEHLVSEEKSKVRDRYENQNPAVFSKFVELMNDFGKRLYSISDFYHQVINLLEDSPDLCEEFLLFLHPDQALQCGKFMEHLALTEMKSFLNKLEVCFSKQPQHLKKIFASWTRLAENPNLTLEMVRNTILPLLRNNTFLSDSFLELLPTGRPPESKMTDFAQLNCDDVDSEHSGEEDVYEFLDIPEDNDDRYGGENCQCCCHSSEDTSYSNRSKHCDPCGIKVSIKQEECKHSVETDDEFPIKSKSPRQRPKISKSMREKPASARCLSLNRKPSGGKLSPSSLTVIHDQDAVAAPCGDENQPKLDLSTLQTDQPRNKDHCHLGESESNVDIEIHHDNHLLSDKECEEEQVKEECHQGNSYQEIQNAECMVSDTDTKDDEIDVQDEDKSAEYISMDEKDEDYEEEEACVDNSGTSSDCDMEYSSEDNEAASWTREEDRIILCTFQSEPDKEKTLTIINAQLPHRTRNEINRRFQLLINLIQKMG
ncbi:hypothetical protein FOCC_FOCC006348 [Frankliniella occidentalis]|nr:hypothetical protein FOCC_FOCC006348 [Frankliniella occidentalis]